jgi:bisanhydrobacterioruberin hydratase
VIQKFSKSQIATVVAIIFHVVGLAGILFFEQTMFITTTPLNLLLSFSLLMWTQEQKNKSFYFFAAIVFITGFVVEAIGVNTGLLFGNYNYGTVLGPQWQKVPLLIGINWFIIIYCSGICTQSLLLKIMGKAPATAGQPPLILKALSVIVDGATVAVAFDWLMEPVAVRLGFWQWNGNGNIPLYNYVCWFFISVGLLSIFHFCTFDKRNKFAVNLLLIQFMFFLLLRTFLKN